jgi:GH15 family glucan-1,4-alpha-glucosidase
MCWLTIDRGIAVAAYTGRQRPEWAALRDQISAEVLDRGWKPELGGFSAAYENSEPDAASLWVGLSGLLPPADPRFVGTVGVVERTLRDGPTVLRYKYDDGLPGTEGGFNLCTSWLIESYALIGRRADAEALFNEYCKLAGPTGMIPEEYDPLQRRALGNHPQAYSHLGLINAALRLAT